MEKDSGSVSIASRCRGALVGLYIGDALAMPVHWYYNREALKRDYGYVTDYRAPKNPHPDSILWRCEYTATGPKDDILHDQARYWQQSGIHYHQFLHAGENTLNLQLCSLLIASLNRNGGYNRSDYVQEFISFMLTPGSHRDTYVEEYARNFFSNYAKGVPPERCGTPEKHIGGLAGIVPIVVFYCKSPDTAREAAYAHLALTHPGEKMQAAAEVLITVLIEVLNGTPLRELLLRYGDVSFGEQQIEELLQVQDEQVVGGIFSTACYVEHSVPSVMYLALKYHDQPEQGLIVNTNLGGDNAYRGAVLGALLGAENGIEAFPQRWVTGLYKQPPELKPAE